MSSSSPENLRLFLQMFVSSYEELEVLLFFARGVRQSWTANELAAALRKPAEPVATALSQLAARGLLESEARTELAYRYAVTNDELRLRIAELDRAYEHERLSVVQMMSDNALERIRRSAIRGMSDAFGPIYGKK
ncbi:MAG TPA: hypothetical protein VEQ59_17295 [Polyangiaceae bacterium]|nr:hypothetical protein [Polyangiaceae bacterium]